jgi:hypothetical protein
MRFKLFFLVLARRAIAIRDRESVGSWLYGVAARMAARARASAIGRNIRERRTNQAAQSIASKAGSHSTALSMRANNSRSLN